MTCQNCQRNVATVRVSLAQNIGLLVARQSKNFTADLCRECGMRMVKSMTLITFFFGWWGLISLFLTPIFLIINIVAWSKLRSLPEPDAPWSPSFPPPLDPGTSLPPSGTLSPGAFVSAPTLVPPPSPSGTLSASALGAPPAYVGSFGQGAPPSGKSRSDSAGNWSLGLSIAALFTFCLPVASIASLVMAWKSRVAAQEEGRAVPKTAWVGVAVSALSLFMLAGTIAIGVYAEHDKTTKVTALRARSEKGRTEPLLTTDVACALVEEQLLEGLYEHKQGVKSVTCKTAPDQANDQAVLTRIAVTWDDRSRQTVDACFRNSGRWFVASLSRCAKAELPAKTAGLTADQQEDRWREAEATALSAEQLVAFTQNLDAIHRAATSDVEPCSSKTLSGRTIPTELMPLRDESHRATGETLLDTVDDDVLEGKRPKGWEFINSDVMLNALDPKASERVKAVKTLFDARYVAVAKSEIARELPTVPASKPGVAYEGGAFIGMLYLGDLQRGEVLCVAPLAFENSDSIKVKTYRGAKASDDEVRTEVNGDLTRQYAKTASKSLDDLFHDKPITASSFGLNDDEPDDPDEADAPPPKPAPVPAKKPKAKTK